MNKPRIWIDADSCPAAVKNIVLKAAIREQLEVTYVANRNIPFSLKSPLFKMVITQNTEGSADDYIVENVCTDDIAVTRDIPLAKRLVDMGLCVLNDRGLLFDAANVEQMLKQRELNMQMNMLGISTGGRWDSYGKKEAADFANCFDRVLSKKMSAYRKQTLNQQN